MRFLFCGLIVGVALGTALSARSQQVTDTQITAIVEALRRAAPKNAPGLYSEWGVTPGIIPSWTKQCIGRELTPTEFGNSTEQARTTVTCIARRELQKQFRATNNNEAVSVRRFACWWLTGKEVGCDSGRQVAYVGRVLSFYQEGRSGQSAPSPSPSPSP